jgi:tetratricopeptide (TPR) repeat protein
MSPRDVGSLLARSTPRLLVVVFAVMVALFVITGFLTRSYRRERNQRAEQQFEAGQELAKQGRYGASIHQYTAALTLTRDNPQYRQALALALMEVGRTSEAELYLLELGKLDPANGIANLMLARIYSNWQDIDRATQHYQRAIYGLWPEDPAGNRIKVRFELVELLTREGETTQVKAELFRLLDETPEDPAMKKRVGHLFFAARLPEDAARIFTEVARENRRDAEAHAGLGDAEFELGHYLSARTAYRQAVLYRPDDLQSRTQLELATEIVDLDPMRRGLGSATRLERSRKLVARSLSALDYCIPEYLEVLPESFQQDVERAKKVVEGKTRQRRTSEFVEANIALAEQLHRSGRDVCGPSPVPDQALDLVLKRLAD